VRLPVRLKVSIKIVIDLQDLKLGLARSLFASAWPK
jgi:hypothetical protein